MYCLMKKNERIMQEAIVCKMIVSRERLALLSVLYHMVGHQASVESSKAVATQKVLV